MPYVIRIELPALGLVTTVLFVALTAAVLLRVAVRGEEFTQQAARQISAEELRNAVGENVFNVVDTVPLQWVAFHGFTITAGVMRGAKIVPKSNMMRLRGWGLEFIWTRKGVNSRRVPARASLGLPCVTGSVSS